MSYTPLLEVLPGTLIESPGSFMDEVWASTSCESSAMVTHDSFDDISELSMPLRALNSYNPTMLWHIAEKLVLDLKKFSMRPFMFRHDFQAMILRTCYKETIYTEPLKAAIESTWESCSISQLGGAVIPKGQVKPRDCRWTALELQRYSVKGIIDMSSEYRFHSYIIYTETSNVQDSILVDIP